ncbi:MAG: DNA polymerase III subunit gamma/tau [Acidiferrobacterales bacterium]|nr:DNA polymerase III subunit gamma/tau [Acidiferrobacterales bacterium]
MSYQALARKWRPQSFDEVIGQEHVVSALANALDSERVHHAYLFTGTRGVGKTTLARIFARALNCETGVSASPCGECAACAGVSQGNYIDLIEVDAASRTRVDDTRELLDNVQYAPTVGRYKIYLIDEVHMLSTHSFNALLKTLEEPPAHVKFLLATTDPQKLPATILSRCIQFNLKAMDIERLFSQLEKILTAESMSFEPEALKVIARSADGSVRDALSLLDQAIAFGNGQVESTQVRSMLGMIDNDFTRRILAHVCDNDPVKVMATIGSLAERSVNFASAMDDILTTLHHIALYQVAPDAVIAKGVDVENVADLSAKTDPELVQLLYQIALTGKRDIPLAPDPRTGFEMALLRMTSFQPQSATAPSNSDSSNADTAHSPPTSVQSSGMSNRGRSRIQRNASTSEFGAPSDRGPSDSSPERTHQNAEPRIARRKFVERPPVAIPQPDSAAVATPKKDDDSRRELDEKNFQATTSQVEEVLPMDDAPPLSDLPPELESSPIRAHPFVDPNQLGTTEGWSVYAQTGGIEGIAKELAMNMVPRSQEGKVLNMVLDERAQHLFNDARLEKINQHLADLSDGNGPRIAVSIETISSSEMETPSLQKKRIVEETQLAADQSFREDPNVQELVNLFDAEIIEDSVRPASD